MKRQNSAQEHEIIELQEQNVEESETDRDKPLNAQTRKLSSITVHQALCTNGGVVFTPGPMELVCTKFCIKMRKYHKKRFGYEDGNDVCNVGMSAMDDLGPMVSLSVRLPEQMAFANGDVYTDEDDYWDPEELLSNGNFHNFSGTVELMCSLPHFSSKDVTKRLTEVYSSSPALGRYFRSAQVISFSNESSTVIYQLVFSVPPSTEGFMENNMNPDFIRNILRQNIYDEDTLNPETSECDRLKLDPTSLT
ncbi:TPA-induced transmembrane protein [Lonchura striata]|uniref:TPA-induced transmembrane protein n=1 Tax=Lonchura striata TaxID=40157 RepID=A0A218UKB1_9PASE|nr:TPA-induced transmembrane protein [Lonchura striata domestica]